MPTLVFETTVAAPLSRVWEFHQDGTGALPALSPPRARVRIESADLPVRAGSRITLTARGPLGWRLKWVARIVELRPPAADARGERAGFVDEQESGPFAAWRHAHEFERLDENTTRLTDRVTYRGGFGPLGWVADRLIVRPQLRAMFRHRHEATRRLLAGAPGGGSATPQGTGPP